MKIYSSQEQLFRLIPQRAPIMMISGVEVDEDGKIHTSLSITDDNWFVKEHLLMEAGLIEHAAQSAAAVIGLQNLKSSDNPHIGYIGEVSDSKIVELPKVGTAIRSDISVLAQIEEITLMHFDTYIEDSPIASGNIKVFLTNE